MSPSSPSSSRPSSSPSSSPPSSPFPPPLRLPRPLGTDAPATCEVPHFAPLRVRGGRYQLHRLVRHRRRALAAGLAVTAAALVAAGPGSVAERHRADPDHTEPHHAERPRGHPAAKPVRRHGPADVVRAPVRIADAAAVRLLRPGDRVDVIAAEDPSAGGGAHVLARGARVASLPESLDSAAGTAADGGSWGGALVVLSVPRATAARLVGASATARLAVTLG
ncbi:hypothetical protein ACGFYV_08600 [Streptomyces sp. NPDC048297]|uniref:hypothetical protein n=1 Tax=Streptomyces sp. NPDC048297 TaxID=3365531 RepID=UPI00371014A7